MLVFLILIVQNNLYNYYFKIILIIKGDQIKSIRIIKQSLNSQNQSSKGIAYIDFVNDFEAKAAVEQSNKKNIIIEG